MASTYGYITVANLEAYESTDYGNISTTLYSDANVEAKITIAERIVNGLIGTTYTGTIPDRIVAATTIIAAQLMRNTLIRNGHLDPRNPDKPSAVEQSENQLLAKLLEPEQADNLDKPNMWVIKH
jgi:hypothetical protein